MTESDVSTIIEGLTTLEKKVDRIYQGLYGIADTADAGFCGELSKLKKDYYDFKRHVLVILAFSAGGGGLIGAGIFKVLGG